jgi:hypothetical protein
LKVFPNPSIGTLNIDYSNYKQVQSIELWDVHGKKIYEDNISANPSGVYNLEISHLSKGSYFIRISTNLGIVTKTIVK